MDEKPKNAEIQVRATLERIFDPKRREGNRITFMAHPLAEVTVDGQKRLEILGTLGGGLEIHDKKTGETWLMNIHDVIDGYLNQRETLDKGAE